MKSFFLVLMLLPVIWAGAQSSFRVTGSVVDDQTGKPVAYANVVISQGSRFLTGTITSEKGQFAVFISQPGKYTITISSVGFLTFSTELEFSTPTAAVLETIRLRPSLEVLEEVIITARQRTVAPDIQSFPVSENLAATSGSLLDVLQTMPGISVDLEGKVKLRGSEKIGFLADGKPSAIFGAGRTGSLKNLPASSIEKIEIISNPSSKYDPDGMAGIINLVFKKESRTGLNGEAGFTWGISDHYLPSLAINYRTRKFNLFANFDGLWKEYLNHNSQTSRRNRINDTETVQLYRTTEPSNAQIYRTGADFFFGKKLNNQLTAWLQYEDEYEENNGWIKYFDSREELRNESGTIRELAETEQNDRMNAAIQFKRTLGKPDATLSSGIIGSWQHEREDYLFTEEIYHPADSVLFPANLKERTNLDHRIASWDIYADLSCPAGDHARLDAGYRSLIRSIDLGHLWYNLISGSPALIPGRNFKYLFREQIHALYATLTGNAGTFHYETGLRAEQVITSSQEDSTRYSFDNNYFRLYPSVKAGFNLAPNQSLLLMWSGRVNRPDFEQLNLVPKYIDPLNLYAGNPELDPEYVHQLELGYKQEWKIGHLMLSGFYKNIRKPIYDVVTISEAGVATYQPQNFNSGYHTGVEMISGFSPLSHLEISGSFTWFQSHISASEKFVTPARSDNSWSAKISSLQNFNTGFKSQIDLWYNAPQITPQGKILEQYAVDFSVQRPFWGGKGTISLKVSDLFDTLEKKEEFRSGSFVVSTFDKPESRFVFIGLKVKF